MYQKHFNTIASTQFYLKDNLEALKLKDSDILISCTKQTEGIGRRGNTWESFPNSLAMSFTFRPNSTPSLTPLEIGLITIEFFNKKFNTNLKLKWPNDILTSVGQKCGGIICHYIDSSTVIAGLGINLGKFDILPTNNFRHGLSSVDQKLELEESALEQISSELYCELLNTKMLDTEILKTKFNEYCAHLDNKVEISEDGKIYIGTFRGIAENGEALVEIDSTIQKFISSSLTILN